MQGRGYNESELGHFVDHEDEAVYAEAVRIFRRNVAKYASRSSGPRATW